MDEKADWGIGTRAEHLDWCKMRALQYVDEGDLNQAFTSLVSDLNKHSETAGHAAGELGMMMLLAGQLQSAADMRNFIEGTA